MADTSPITTIDEFEEEYRKGAGVILPGRASKQASLDNIRRAGDGIGDNNPLWRDARARGQEPLRHDYGDAEFRI